MSDQIYQTPEQGETVQPQKEKSLIVLVLLIFILGPFVGMLYLARPIRAVIYFVLQLSVVFVEFINLSAEIHPYFSEAANLAIILVGLGDALQIRKNMSLFKLNPTYSRAYVLVPSYVSIVLLIFLARSSFYDFYQLPSSSMLPTYKPGDYIYVDKSKSAQTTLAGISITESPNQAMHEMVWRGNVIVFYKEGSKDSSYIKRIIGIPNDIVTFQGHSYQIENCQNGTCTSVFIEQKEREPFVIDPSENNPHPMDFTLFRETLGSHSFDTLHTLKIGHSGCYMASGKRIAVPEGYVLVMGDSRDNSLDSRFFGLVKIEDIIGELL